MNQQIVKRVEETPLVQSKTQVESWINPQSFDQAIRVADVLCDSELVPVHYRGKHADCVIAVQTAFRVNMDPFLYMQQTYVVGGKLGILATFAISLINNSGIVDGRLQYEVVGEDPAEKSYKVRAWAKLRDGTTAYGEWINWEIVNAEGWFARGGSKWKTMPGMMFKYRAAMWFGRTVMPEILLGMNSLDELQDEPVETTVTAATSKMNALAEKLATVPSLPATPEAKPAKQIEAKPATELETYLKSPEKPEADAKPAEAQAESDPLADWKTFANLIKETAIDLNVPETEMTSWMNSCLIRIGKKGKGETTTIEWRRATLQAFKDKFSNQAEPEQAAT